MIYAQPGIRPGEWDTKMLFGILRYKYITYSLSNDQTEL